MLTTSGGQIGRTYITTDLIVTSNGGSNSQATLHLTSGATRTSTSTAGAASQTNAPSPATSGGLSQGAIIGIGVGAGVGGLLAIGGVIAWLVKSGAMASLGIGSAAANAAGGAAGSAAMGGQPPGDVTQMGHMADKMGFSSQGYYTPGGESAQFGSGAPPGYTPSGAEAGNFSAPGGQAAPPYGGPTGAEAGNFTSPGNAGFGPTGSEAGNFSAPGNPGFGPTGAEAGNFTAPGNPGFAPTGTEAGNFSAPGVGAAGTPGFGSMNPGYMAAPIAAGIAVAVSTAVRKNKKEGGRGPSSPVIAGGPPMAPTHYSPQSVHHELAGGDVHGVSEMASPEVTHAIPYGSYLSRQTTSASIVSPLGTGMGSGPYSANVSEMGTPVGGYASPVSPPPVRHTGQIHEIASSTVSGPAELAGGYYDPHGAPPHQGQAF